MQKIITLDNGQTLELNASSGWLLVYRKQFGRDIMPDVMPMIQLLLTAGTSLFGAGIDNETGEIDIAKALSALDAEKISDICMSAIGLEFTTLLQIVWAMVKNGDDSTPAFEVWAKNLEYFPPVQIVAELIDVLADSYATRKNRPRLKAMAEKITAYLSSGSLSPERSAD